MKMYQLKYTAEIEFTENCYWGNGGGLVGWGGSFFADRPDPIVGGIGHYKAGTKGQRESVSATLVFQKADNGWSPAN